MPRESGTCSPGRVPRRRRPDGELTWRRVIDAAVECILDRGYYHASSNEIARRAGVTWGTIQYQFGSREGLLLEVLNDRWRRLQERVETAQVVGETLEERLLSVMDVLASHYGCPEHIVQLQILLELSKDPETSSETRRAVARHGAELSRAWQPLFVRALGRAAESPELVRHAFRTLRGYLIGNVISSSIADVREDPSEKHLLVVGLAHVIRQESGRLGLDISDFR
jgi:AcrR family transcriptional regulator